MTILAHLDAGLINTWGFAYVGGIIGLFTVALLYVKGTLGDGSSRAGDGAPRSTLAVFGRGVIVVGGLCGVSLGLGLAGLLERAFVDDVDVSSVVQRLCEPGAEDRDLHDDIEHAIDDLDAEAVRAAHRDLHAGPSIGPEFEASVDRLVMALTAADGDPVESCAASSEPTS